MTVQGTGDATVVDSAPKRIVPVGVGPRKILEGLGLDKRTIVGRRHAGRPAARRCDPAREARPDRGGRRDRPARPRPRAQRDARGRLRRARQLDRRRRPGDRRHRPAHRPGRRGAAADRSDRGEADGRGQGGRRLAARDRVRRHGRLRDNLQPHACSAT